jgi:hypothetical protein
VIRDFQGLLQVPAFPRALSASHLSAFYHPRQIAKLRKTLGITLKSTKGLLNEKQFGRVSELTVIASYRRQVLIKPVGYAMAGPGANPFYHPPIIRGRFPS